MKKKREVMLPYGGEMRLHIRKMKLTAILLFIVCVTFGNSFSQVRLTVRFEKSDIRTVLQTIEEKTDYIFLYKDEIFDFSKKVSADFTDAKFEVVLKSFCEQTGTTFEIRERQIILKTREANSLPAEQQPQKKTASGKVTDSKGGTLPGVSVVVKGTTIGTITDGDGKFTLQIPVDAKILLFSFVGMKTQEMAIAGKTSFDVVLEEETVGIEEVVAVGYGTMKKSDITGSVASVKGHEIVNKGNLNTTQALQGLVSGVTVVNTSGKPGSASSIVIRGQGSYGNTDPLYIVDGAITGNINFIDPNEIASLEILKDASSAAIYGSRAANGVILITTKRGKGGMSKVTFSSNFGVQSIANKLDLATSQQWRDKEVWKYTNEGKPVPAKLQDGSFDPSVSTDWQDVLFRNAIQQNYNLSFSGGGEKNNFNFAIGYASQDGILVASKFERINLRMNSDFIAGKFKFGESLSISRSNDTGSGTLTNFYTLPIPAFSPKDANGNYQVMSDGFGVDPAQNLYMANPLAQLELNEQSSSNIKIVANVYGTFTITDGLFIKTSGNVEAITGHDKGFTPYYSVGHLTNSLADLSESRSEGYILLLENTLNFKRVFGDHSIESLAGWTRQLETLSGITLLAEGFPNGISQAYAANTVLPGSTGSKIASTMESYLGRINYSYKGRYLLTASIRQDASSRLIKSLRTGVFPSFSLGWVASDESFFPKDGFMNSLKFRGGYGELGRLNSVSEYQTQNTLAMGGNTIDYVLGTDQHYANGISIAKIINNSILWERAKSTNIAMETSIWDDRIFLNAEYFIKNTQDLQFNAPIPLSVSTIETSILVNAGDIQNKGFELTMGYRKKAGEFTFDASVNLYKLKNKVISFNNPEDVFIGGQYGFSGQNATKAEVGREMSNFWLLRTDGIFQSTEEIQAYNKDGVLIQPNAKPGDLRFKDMNGDGKISVDDKQFISGSIPDLEYGINFNGAYKNVDFSLLVQGVAGAKLFNGVSRAWDGILADQSTDSWRVDNPDAMFYRASITDPNANRGDNDFYLENSSYFRLKNIQLGYTLPKSALSILNLTKVRLNVTGQNLLTITQFTGYDPENVSFGLNRGVNTNVYPLAKTILFGISVEF